MSLISRLILLCIFLSFLGLQSKISAQDSLLNKPVNIKFKNTTLKLAFKRIEQQLNCYFTFEGSIVNLEKLINKSFKDTPLKICLSAMLEDTNLIYKSIDNHIIIKRKFYFDNKEDIIKDIPDFITVRGQVVDGQGDGPLPFVSIGIVGFGIGSITNAQGEFILKVPGKHINEKISIIQLGYLNKFIPVKQLIDTFAVFQMERSFITIQEVIIRKTDPKFLIRSAISKIKNNYCTEPVYLTGFYRESVERRYEYMFFSEAVIKIYKSSYIREYDLDLIKLLKSRKMQDVRQEDTLILKLKSGLSTCLELDMVKNPISFINENNFDSYDYSMSDIVTFNDRNAYLIEFEQKKSVDEALFKGKLYIDIEKLAIIGSEFSINPQKVSETQSNYVVKKRRDIKVRMTNIEYFVNYRLVNNKYYLNYVRGNLQLKMKKNGKLFPVDFETSLEMAINEIDTINVERFKRNEIEDPYTIFVDDFHEYDEAFWENYNFIKPDEPLQESIRNFSFKLEY
jgi:hypothetical protein